jgi:hypothetical protein
MTTEKIQFTKEKETMLMTLSGRAIQSQWKNPILRDPWAEEAMQHIDYDISKQYREVGSWSMWNKIGCTIIATRDATFDRLTTRYLADHLDATVLHLGCGMDSRVFRVDPPASVQWFDVDYPDVIDLRCPLLPDRRFLLRDNACPVDRDTTGKRTKLERAGIIVSVGPLQLRHTAREFTGRIQAVMMPSILASQLVAVILAGFLASKVLYGLHSTFLGLRFGPLDTIFTGVGTIAVMAGLYVLYKSITASAAFEAHIESNATQETATEHPEAPGLEAPAQTEASRS